MRALVAHCRPGLGENAALGREDSCGSPSVGPKFSERDAVDTPDPAGQVALVGKAGRSGDFRQFHLAVTHELGRLPQAQLNDVAVRRHAHGLGEYAREMESASSSYARERSYFYLLVQMGNDIICQPMEYLLAQATSHGTLTRGGVPCDQSVNESSCNLAPKQWPA